MYRIGFSFVFLLSFLNAGFGQSAWDVLEKVSDYSDDVAKITTQERALPKTYSCKVGGAIIEKMKQQVESRGQSFPVIRKYWKNDEQGGQMTLRPENPQGGRYEQQGIEMVIMPINLMLNMFSMQENIAVMGAFGSIGKIDVGDYKAKYDAKIESETVSTMQGQVNTYKVSLTPKDPRGVQEGEGLALGGPELYTMKKIFWVDKGKNIIRKAHIENVTVNQGQKQKKVSTVLFDYDKFGTLYLPVRFTDTTTNAANKLTYSKFGEYYLIKSLSNPQGTMSYSYSRFGQVYLPSSFTMEIPGKQSGEIAFEYVQMGKYHLPKKQTIKAAGQTESVEFVYTDYKLNTRIPEDAFQAKSFSPFMGGGTGGYQQRGR